MAMTLTVIVNFTKNCRCSLHLSVVVGKNKTAFKLSFSLSRNHSKSFSGLAKVFTIQILAIIGCLVEVRLCGLKIKNNVIILNWLFIGKYWR